MESFEALSNDELHSELLRHGFPNMPVTTTTRKVLLKKLQLKLENGAKSSRRETIDVIKFSSDEEPEIAAVATKKKEVAKRRTVGGEKLSKIADVVPASIQAANRRRSGRVTPLAEQMRPSQPSRQTPVAEYVEDSDEDEIHIIVERRPPSVTQRRSKSKSPSLGKSDTITTSYKHIPAVPTVAEAPILEDEFEEPDDVEDDYDDEPILVVPPPVFAKENRYKPTSVATKRYTERPQLPESGWQTRRPITVSGGGQASNFEDPVVSRKSTGSIYASPMPNAALSSQHYSASNYRAYGSDSNFAETAELDVNKSPYLSNFTRRLSTLKADPLDSSIRNRRPFARAGVDRQQVNRRTDTLWDNVKHVVMALHRKYKVHFAILLIALVLLLVFIFFFM